MKVLIKAMRPHRQKVLTEDGKEMRLQQWANKKAGAALRSSSTSDLRPHYSTEQFQQARNALMREAVANPDEHGLKFMGERMPFEGQTLEESLSEPDVEGEQAAIDNQFSNRDESGRTEEEQAMDAKPFMSRDDHDAEFAASKYQKPISELFDEQGKLRQTLPQGGKMSEKDMHDEALADWEARQDDINFSREQGHTEGFEGKPYHEMEQGELDADKKRFYGMYPHLKPQEEGGFDPDAEAEHLRRIMTSRDVAIRDAWSVLKQDLSFMTEEERRQYEIRQKMDALRRHGALPQEPLKPSGRFPSSAGNA